MLAKCTEKGNSPYILKKINEKTFKKKKNFTKKILSLATLLLTNYYFHHPYFIRTIYYGTVRSERTNILVEGKLVHCLVFEPENLTKSLTLYPVKHHQIVLERC